MAFVGRLLLIIIPELFQQNIDSSNLPTLNLLAASGINGIISLPEAAADSPRRVEALAGVLQKRFPTTRYSQPEQISRWLTMLGYDDERVLDEATFAKKFSDCADGMRSFVVAAEPAVSEFGRLLAIDVLESVALVETMIRTALKAITDPDAKYDCGFLFMRSTLGSNGHASLTRQAGEKQEREVKALEDIDGVLGSVLIPALLKSAELHGIEYAIAITGDPCPTDAAHPQEAARHTPLTITALGAMRSALERVDEEETSFPEVSGETHSEGFRRVLSKSASTLQREHAQRRRRDSVSSFSFPQSKWDLCGLGRLMPHDVWGALCRFLAHEVLVCDSAPAADGEEGDEAVLVVKDEELPPDEFAEDGEDLK